jgi:hypothetical protein
VDTLKQIILALHILNNRQEHGTLPMTMKSIRSCNKSKNCWENFYIQVFRQQNKLTAEQLSYDDNMLYALAQVGSAELTKGYMNRHSPTRHASGTSVEA